MTSSTSEASFWGSRAGGRAKWDALIDRSMQPVTEWLCEAIDLAPGMRVLDVACGTGQPALTLARRVGPAGSVVGVDIAAAMIEGARRLAEQGGIDNATFEVTDGEQMPFPDAGFDAATCRLGVMYFKDAVAQAREVLRVLRPGGRYALASWGPASENPRHALLEQVIGREFPDATSSGSPGGAARGVYAFAEPARFVSTLEAAGFRAGVCEAVSVDWDFASAEEFWLAVNEISPSPRLDALSEADQARVKQAVMRELERYRYGDAIRMAGSSICAWGEKT